MLIVKLPFMLAWWAVQIAIKLPTVILGYFVVPLLWRYRYTDIDMVPLWAVPWVNPEDWHGGFLNYDGSLPKWWIEREGDGFWAFYRYHARRNPADGLRNFKALQCWINPDKVEYWTPKYMRHYDAWYDRTPGWRGYVAWQGLYLGVKVQWVREKSYSEFRFGFRLTPADKHHPLPDSSARKMLGASFASKLIWKRDL